MFAKRIRLSAIVGAALIVTLPSWGQSPSVQRVGAPPPRAAQTITVLAAASLTDALTDVSTEYTRRTGVVVRHSFASSAQIARQLEAGARADLFIAADGEWMDYLADRELIRKTSRRPIAGNRLAVITASANLFRFDPKRKADWRSAIDESRLATGDPDSVPLGRYAREALEKLGLWGELGARLARAENARAALALVARGEAPLGIVYLTDALAEPRVRIVATLPDTLHKPIVYPAALTTNASAAAAAYLEFLGGTEAQTVFTRRGFASTP